MKHKRVLIALGLIVLCGAIFAGRARHLTHELRFMECFQRPQSGGVAAVGDSITAGTTDADLGLLGRDSWLSQATCDGGVRYSYNAAIPGRTSSQARSELRGVLHHHPRVVVVMAGTNDLLTHQAPTVAAANLQWMVRAIDSQHITPVLATLPPLDRAPAALAALNRAIRQLAHHEHVALIDFHAVLADGERYKPGLTVDGIHPTVAGAKLMASAAAPVLRSALTGPGR